MKSLKYKFVNHHQAQHHHFLPQHLPRRSSLPLKAILPLISSSYLFLLLSPQIFLLQFSFWTLKQKQKKFKLPYISWPNLFGSCTVTKIISLSSLTTDNWCKSYLQLDFSNITIVVDFLSGQSKGSVLSYQVTNRFQHYNDFICSFCKYFLDEPFFLR